MAQRHLSEKKRLHDYDFVDYKNAGNRRVRTKMRRAMKRTCRHNAIDQAMKDYYMGDLS